MTSMAHFSLPRMCSVIILCLRSGQSSINLDECWTLQLYISNFLSKVSLPSVNAGFPPSCIPDQTFYQIDSNHSLSPFTNFSQFKLNQGDVTSEIPLFVEKWCLFLGFQMSVAPPKRRCSTILPEKRCLFLGASQRLSSAASPRSYPRLLTSPLAASALLSSRVTKTPRQY